MNIFMIIMNFCDLTLAFDKYGPYTHAVPLPYLTEYFGRGWAKIR